MANETIGRIKCPIGGDWAELRKDKQGKFYWYGKAGMIKPNLEPGQEFILSKAILFSEKQRIDINSIEPKFGRRLLSEEQDQEEKKEVNAPESGQENDEKESGWLI